jgi:hypothetical protein
MPSLPPKMAERLFRVRKGMREGFSTTKPLQLPEKPEFGIHKTVADKTNGKITQRENGTTFPAAPTTFKTPLIVHDPLKIIVANELLMACDAIQEKFKHLEWSIYAKGSWKSDGFFVEKEFVVPNQVVTSTSVDPDNSEVQKFKIDGYNVVIHSHPFARSNTFSSGDHADRGTICTNSVCSILYSFGEFTTATMMFEIDPLNKCIFDVGVEVETVINNSLLPNDIDQKIKRKHYPKYGDKGYDRGTVYDDYDYNYKYYKRDKYPNQQTLDKGWQREVYGDGKKNKPLTEDEAIREFMNGSL